MILKEILQTKGYKARTVQLIRQIGSNYDTHVVTEVFDEAQQKYILLDPTFNIMFKKNKEYLNVYEIRKGYLYEKQKIEIIELKAKTVQNYTEYPLDYLSLYNNVLVTRLNNEIGIARLVSKLPIFHYYLGRAYFVIENKDSVNISKLYNIFYFYIPIFLLVNILLILISFIAKKYKRV